jgi:hypothetical protein
LFLPAAVLGTTLADPKEPSAIICNALRHQITCVTFSQPGSETPASTRKYTIPVNSCFMASGTVQAVLIERQATTQTIQVELNRYNTERVQQTFLAVNLVLKVKEAADVSSASPCCWVVTEEAGAVLVKRSSGTSHPYYWHVPVGTGSYDVRDQATIEAWKHDAATRREGVKHITQLCQAAAAAASASSTSPGPDSTESPTNGSPKKGTASRPMPLTPRDPSPMSRLLAVLRDIPSSYTASDFAYVPLTTTLEELMAAPLPPAQLQEVAKVLIDKGLGPKCPALNAAASPSSRAT